MSYILCKYGINLTTANNQMNINIKVKLSTEWKLNRLYY